MRIRQLVAPALVALATSACKDSASAPLALAPTTLSLVQTATTAATMAFAVADTFQARPGQISRSLVDSLMVSVRAVAIRPALTHYDSLVGDSLLGDSCLRFRHGGPFDPDSAWAHRGFGPPAPAGLDLEDWVVVEVVSGGRIDLMHLPTELADGLVIAADSIPAGSYTGVALLLDSATIWLNTPVVTPFGDSLAANTAIPVELPRMGVFVPADVTVTEGGGDVTIVFDPAVTLDAAMITPSGYVILAPAFRHRARAGF